MFNKEYVFETKSTKLRRSLISGLLSFVFILAILASFIVYIPYFGRNQKELTDKALYQISPDAIAVYTGDKGRISYALDLLKKNPSAKLFISGVYATNSFQTLLTKNEIISAEELEGVQVDLDYNSRDTFENVRETVDFLKHNPELNKILIISSDYHILRIKMIVSHYLKDSEKDFYFDSTITNFNNRKNIKKLFWETLKIFRTFILLNVLGIEINQ
ncbi:MAG TPA: YdcF family protein [Bacteriovoracaceae bacterium]|nr:YdcF family protein [Bacteriovoracaceae bacterium]